MMISPQLELRAPSHQNAVDLFEGRWLTRIEEVYPGLTSGPGNCLKADHRPAMAANHLGWTAGSFHGMDILELGPLEGSHTYQIAKLGCTNLLSIEANTQAFLRCLVMKEILGYQCKFLLGDVLSYLQKEDKKWDLIFCSGILYHMENPYNLIKAMTANTDRVFIWTHYFDENSPKGPDCKPRIVDCDGLNVTFYEHTYGVDLEAMPFWGGNKPTAAWLSKETISSLFQHFGFSITIHEEDRAYDLGYSFSATAIRVPLDFNEADYLRANPDVAAAVENKQQASGLHHWLQFGKAANRPWR